MCSFTLLLKNFPWLPVYWITTNFLMCNLKLSTDTVRQRETKLCIFSQCFSNFNTYMHDLIDKMWFWFSSPGLILFRTGPKQNLRWLELREQRRALSIKSLGVRERGGRRKNKKKASEARQWKIGVRDEQVQRDSQEISPPNVTFFQTEPWDWVFDLLGMVYISLCPGASYQVWN